jgi:hypothetical protein
VAECPGPGTLRAQTAVRPSVSPGETPSRASAPCLRACALTRRATRQGQYPIPREFGQVRAAALPLLELTLAAMGRRSSPPGEGQQQRRIWTSTNSSAESGRGLRKSSYDGCDEGSNGSSSSAWAGLASLMYPNSGRCMESGRARLATCGRSNLQPGLTDRGRLVCDVRSRSTNDGARRNRSAGCSTGC